MISIDHQVETKVPDELFSQVATACFLVCGLQKPCTLNLCLTDNEGIRQINQAWRGIDQATDVLSFPSLQLAPDDLFDEHDARSLAIWDSEQGAFHLGDIIISLERAQAQAMEFGQSIFRELSYLMAHGVLHLMGHDHQTQEDQATMRALEEQTLATIHLDKSSDSSLLQAARDARQMAYVPYSKYRVGAALLDKQGQVFTGCNVENASFGLTNCAERTALFKAVSDGSQDYSAIAIAADQTAPWPCGACRQVLHEFAPNLRVLVTWGDGQVAQTTLDQLLPHSFTGFLEDIHG